MKWMLVIVLLGSKGTLLRSEPVKSEEACRARVAAVQEQFNHSAVAHQCIDIGAWVAMKVEEDK